MCFVAGADHHVVATTLVNLGSVYGRLGEHETQREILERALRIMEAEFGVNSHKERELKAFRTLES